MASLRANSHHLGALMVALSAVAWSTAGIFTKGVAADVWAVLFWRGLVSMVVILAYIAWRKRGSPLTGFSRLGFAGWAVATVSSAATLAYIASFKHTSVANVAIVYATAPLVAAAVAWVWIGERPRSATLAASVAALAGVAVMVGGSAGKPNLTGDLLAVAMTLGMALVVVMIRRFPEAPMMHAICLSSLQLTLLGAVMTDPFAVPAREIWILAGFGVVFAGAVVLLTEGARLIPAAETTLLGALEAPLAPIWAWFLLSEVPVGATVVGGCVVLFALIWHQVRSRQPVDVAG